MGRIQFIRGMFVVAALYDGILGLAFLLAGPSLFARFGVTPPNHWGYVQFSAGLLVVFGVMFAAIAMDPVRNRNLIPYGVLLKVCYLGVTGFYWCSSSGLPTMWKPFTVMDAGFALLFVWSFVALRAATGLATLNSETI